MGRDYRNPDNMDYLNGLQNPDDDYVPVSYDTQDMRNINEKVNRILYGDVSEDIVDISKNATPHTNVYGNSGKNISSYSDGKIHNDNIDDYIYDNTSGIDDRNKVARKKKPASSKKKIAIASVISASAVLCIVLVLVLQAVVAPKDNLLADMGIVEKQTDPVVIANSDGEFVFAKGCRISGFDISGLTFEEAENALVEKELEARPAVDIKVNVNDEENTYTQDDFAFSYNTKELLQKEKEFSEKLASGKEMTTAEDSNGNDYYVDAVNDITAQLDTSSIEKLVQKIDKKYDKKAKNATVKEFNPNSKDMFVFASGKKGRELDEDDLLSQIKSVISQGDAKNGYKGIVEISTTPVQPDVTTDFLEENIQLLAQWTTVSTNNANGNQNMSVSLKACNGSVIDPGEIWSFNDCTGDSNDPDNGYAKAGVIVDGKFEEGYGGGICQSSTTIYNAAVRSNLEVYERHNHTYPSVYAYSGFDAAIDYGNFDLKLKNNSEYQVFLSCYMEGATLYATFYGVKTGSYATIDTYSENYDITKKYYRSRAYRIYRDANGKEIDKEELPNSYYSLDKGGYVQGTDPGGVSYVSGGQVSARIEAESSKPESVSSAAPATQAQPKPTKPQTQAPETTAAPKPTKPPKTTKPQTQAPETTAAPKPTKPPKTNPPETVPAGEETE